MKHLRQLEDQSVYILREAYKHFNHLAMLWSMGKDSTVLLWLARKAFFGHVPFPLLHVDTSYKIPAMIEYRDRLAREPQSADAAAIMRATNPKFIPRNHRVEQMIQAAVLFRFLLEFK